MTPDEITIAVTVYDRRAYIEQAISSALAQTLPVRVMVVEDCGPDAGLQSFVVGKFGSRIDYHRNPKRRGLFDNWNVCIELCRTPWLCLLHDDDFLEPRFAEAMIEVAAKIPGKGLYYGQCRGVNASGKEVWLPPASSGPECVSMDVNQAALMNPILFPGEIFRGDLVQALGGFRPTSQFTGDWDVWLKLAVDYGAAGIHRIVGNQREHFAEGRGTTRVVRNGKFYAFTTLQTKKNLALLRSRGIAAEFKRTEYLSVAPVGLRFMLQCASGFSPRLLAYNSALFVRSRSINLLHFIFQRLTACLGPGFLSRSSRLYNLLAGS
jgi:glycosyltransferase involved in cell wall biosynthesis